MVIKVYISGISGNKEVKKRQQRVLLILDSKNVKYEVIDIAEPGAEDAKDFMQNNSTSMGATISDPNPRHPLPPQIFNDDEYCGDYDQFDMANEIDEMEKFLKLEVSDPQENLTSNAEIKLENGDVTPPEETNLNDEQKKEDGETKENAVPNDQETLESKEQSNNVEKKESEETKVLEEGEGNEDKETNESKSEQVEDEKENEESATGGEGDKAENDEDEKDDDA